MKYRAVRSAYPSSPVSLSEQARSRTGRSVDHLGIYLEADEGNLSSPQLVALLTLVVEVGFIQGSVSYSHVGLDEGNIRYFQGRAEGDSGSWDKLGTTRAGTLAGVNGDVTEVLWRQGGQRSVRGVLESSSTRQRQHGS